MKKRTEKKAKAKAPAETKAPEPNKQETKDLPNRELLENVRAIKLKKGSIAIGPREVVYESGAGVCIFNRDLKKRTHWLAKKRVLEIERTE